MNIKNLACLAAAFAASTVLADSITISLGITRVVSSSTNTIVAVPYGGFEQGQNMTVSNVVKTANLQAGDLCYAMSGSDNLYNAWELDEADAAGVKYWKPTTQVSMTNGHPKVETSQTPDSVYLTPGSAIWIIRKRATLAELQQPIYIWGQYTNVVASTITASANGTWNLVANCGLKAMYVDEMIESLGTSNWVYGDQIVIPQDDGKETGFMKKYKDGKWFGEDYLSSTKIDPGKGCWIFKQTTGGTIQWPKTAD